MGELANSMSIFYATLYLTMDGQSTDEPQISSSDKQVPSNMASLPDSDAGSTDHTHTKKERFSHRGHGRREDRGQGGRGGWRGQGEKSGWSGQGEKSGWTGQGEKSGRRRNNDMGRAEWRFVGHPFPFSSANSNF